MTDQRLPTYLIDPSKPKLRLPPGSWDAHGHIFGLKDRYPFAAATAILLMRPGKACSPWMRCSERCVIVSSAVHGIDNRVLDIIAERAPSEELRRKFMVENPRRLYDRDASS
jgi:hypothetical protein